MRAPAQLQRVDLEDLRLASELLEPKWTTTVLFHLATGGPRRFGVLRRAVGRISERVLIERLRTLEAQGLVSRSVRATVPPEVTYAMTPHGRTLCAMIEAMARWGGRHRRFLARRTTG